MNWRIVLRKYANFIPTVSIPPYTRPSLANDRLLILNIEVFPTKCLHILLKGSRTSFNLQWKRYLFMKLKNIASGEEILEKLCKPVQLCLNCYHKD